MARTPRRRAESDIYHVVARGVGRQIIFEDDADRRRFLALLKERLADTEGALLAWCLMDNHFHLLLRMPLEELSKTMRSLQTAYALFFNRRHDRVGHLFQDRFKSEPVEEEAYLLTVVRYIHRNPVKAGFSETCRFRWSSYNAYLGLPDESASTDCELVLSLFGTVENFVRFHLEEDEGEESGGEQRCLDADDAPRPSKDERALVAAREVLGDVRPEKVAALPRAERDEAIRRLRGARLSIRQIERITGVSRGIVSRVRT